MERPRSPDEPASKKAKISPARPSTRAHPVIVLSDDDEDYGFDFESDGGSSESEQGAQDDGPEEEDQLASDEDEAMQEGAKTADVVVLSSDSEHESTPVAPPEEPRVVSKGK